MLLKVMSHVQYLSDANFTASSGATLKINIQGIVFVMFKTDDCKFSQAFTPVFERELPVREQRVIFAIANVGQFRNIATMSQTTSTPIRTVPSFVFYVDGTPKTRYKGDKTVPKILAFLSKMITEHGHAQARFMPPPHQRPSPSHYGGGGEFGFAPIQPSATKATVAASIQNKGPALNLASIRQQREDDARLVPDGFIPHNAPYWPMMRKEEV